VFESWPAGQRLEARSEGAEYAGGLVDGFVTHGMLGGLQPVVGGIADGRRQSVVIPEQCAAMQFELAAGSDGFAMQCRAHCSESITATRCLGDDPAEYA
jgi:hypothetical protein